MSAKQVREDDARKSRLGVEVREVSPSDRPGVTGFIRLERDLMAAYPLFVSDVDADVRTRLSGRSPYFSAMHWALLVASSDGRDVARCAALINERYQRTKGESVGFVGYFAAVPDAGAAVDQMLTRAESWLKERGVTRVIAPYNGAAAVGFGMMTDGSIKSPVFPFTWNPPYYRAYFDAAGYAPRYPLWVYTVDFGSPQYQARSRQAIENAACTVRSLDR